VKAPTTAIVLAAGLGTRMRPLTDDRPKALVEVGGRALIDHMLDRLAQAGVRRVVVNVHAFADRLEAHLGGRTDLDIVISDERDALLETGGGLKRAAALLDGETILVANIDSVWREGPTPALETLIGAWDPARMDDLLLLAPLERTIGFDGPGDFFRDADGRLQHRGEAAAAPLAYVGVQMMATAIIAGWPDGAFGIFPRWMEMAAKGRLVGAVMDGLWMHVGDPAALRAAQAELAAAR
jgi:MurNAc alpha-1-phosphate uridylyltransferase